MSMETFLTFTALLISWLCASLGNCSETTVVVSNLLQSTAASPKASPAATAAFITITPGQRTTSSLEVKWEVRDGYLLSKSYLEARRANSDDESGVSVITPDLGNATFMYEICDLMTNSKYEICMYAEVTELPDSNSTSPVAASTTTSLTQVECIYMSTIPMIRSDSLIVLLCVLAYVLLMILIGYLCWRRAHKQKEEQLLQEEEDSEVEEKAIENGKNKPILLSAPPPQPVQQRPRSAIEDEDIPFITPPKDQLEKDKHL